MKKDLITIKDLSVVEINKLFKIAAKLKKRKYPSQALNNKTLAMIFQKPSTRTRVSFEVGMNQLGGNAIYLSPDDIKLGDREATKDIAQTLSRYLDGIMARTFAHQDIIDLAKHATIPVINGLTDKCHPCQGLSDLFTIKEKFGELEGITLAFIGDGNNVLNSLIAGCEKLGINLKIATPAGYEPDNDTNVSHDPVEAVTDADVVYTDVWTSMGQEAEYKKRLRDFKGFQVNKELLNHAKEGALVMHCLPAHRGEEITDEVMDSSQSIVFDQAENRLHVEKAILLELLK